MLNNYQTQILNHIIQNSITKIPIGMGQADIIKAFDDYCLEKNTTICVIVGSKLFKTVYDELEVKSSIIPYLSKGKDLLSDLYLIDFKSIHYRHRPKVLKILQEHNLSYKIIS